MNKKILSELKELKGNEGELYDHVIDYLLDRCDDDTCLKTTINDILEHGCQSGTVSHLVYYSDTHKFFEEYYDDIEELRIQYETEFGIPLEIKGDMKNWFAWFGFEETLRKIANDLLLDY